MTRISNMPQNYESEHTRNQFTHELITRHVNLQPAQPGFLRAALLAASVHAPAVALGGNRLAFLVPSMIIVLLLFAAQLRRLRPPEVASWLWIAVLVWSAAQIALGITPDLGEAIATITRLALYTTVFLCAAALARDGWAGRMTRVAALWITSVSAFGLWAWASGWNPVLGSLEAYLDALEATFVNRNAFALYASFGMLAALAARWDEGGVGWVLAAAICALAAALTFSRGGIAAATIGLCVFAAMRRKGGAALLMGAAGMAIALSATPRFEEIVSDPRFEIYPDLWRATWEAPFTGRGVGGFQDAFRVFVGAEWRWGDWDHAHQQYLETAFELGWPAALAMFAAIIAAAPRRADDPQAALAWSALAAAGAHAMVDFSLAIPSVAMTLALFLGLASQRR